MPVAPVRAAIAAASGSGCGEGECGKSLWFSPLGSSAFCMCSVCTPTPKSATRETGSDMISTVYPLKVDFRVPGRCHTGQVTHHTVNVRNVQTREEFL